MTRNGSGFRKVVVVGSLLGVVVSVPAVSFALSADSSRLAVALVRRDPGARLGGNTIVLTGDNQEALAVPGRPNFIIGLGSHETINGAGVGADQLGALGSDVTIRAGSGNDLIHGGPRGDLIGGAGHDLLIDPYADATVRVNSSGNEVVVSGKHDRVLCARGIRGVVIYARAGDSIGRECRADHAVVHPAAAFAASVRAPRAATAQASVSGSGSNQDPYVSPCTSGSLQDVNCTVSFPPRELAGLWYDEYVPAYQCPLDHRYLINKKYTPYGTNVPDGVEVEGLGAISVWISNDTLKTDGGSDSGTKTGFLISSATNWSFGTASYRLVLHCTRNPFAGIRPTNR